MFVIICSTLITHATDYTLVGMRKQFAIHSVLWVKICSSELHYIAWSTVKWGRWACKWFCLALPVWWSAFYIPNTHRRITKMRCSTAFIYSRTTHKWVKDYARIILLCMCSATKTCMFSLSSLSFAPLVLWKIDKKKPAECENACDIDAQTIRAYTKSGLCLPVMRVTTCTRFACIDAPGVHWRGRLPKDYIAYWFWWLGCLFLHEFWCYRPTGPSRWNTADIYNTKMWST